MNPTLSSDLRRNRRATAVVVILLTIQLPLALLMSGTSLLGVAIGHVPVCHDAPWRITAAIGVQLADCPDENPPAVETPADVLKPNGVLIGRPGTGSSTADIREVPGGLPKAEEIYARLHQGGGVIPDPDYPGERREVPSGGQVGIRPGAAGSPAVDINIPSVPEVTKIHFPAT